LNYSDGRRKYYWLTGKMVGALVSIDSARWRD
jgi:hypothetical protein